MAKTQKFSEDLLLEAVVKYAEIVKTKIKATELAQWARKNVEGLEDVRDYHFMRPIKERDLKTGKTKYVTKPCTAKMEEINKARSVTASINGNPLLRSVNADAMFELPLSVQKKLVVETRETFDKLLSKNGYLSTENDALKRINKEQAKIIEDVSNKISEIQKKQVVLEKRLNYILKVTDENKRKDILANMGIEDGSIDINQYKKSLEDDLEEMFDLGKALKQYRKIEQNSEDSNLLNNVLGGINFE